LWARGPSSLILSRKWRGGRDRDVRKRLGGVHASGRSEQRPYGPDFGLGCVMAEMNTACGPDFALGASWLRRARHAVPLPTTNAIQKRGAASSAPTDPILDWGALWLRWARRADLILRWVHRGRGGHGMPCPYQRQMQFKSAAQQAVPLGTRFWILRRWPRVFVACWPQLLLQRDAA
jgi:hypothetical protein